MATSTWSHSPVKTESTLPPASTRSAGSSPRATAIQCASMRVKDKATAVPALPIAGADGLLHRGGPALSCAAGRKGRANQHEDESDPHPSGERLVEDQNPRQSRDRRIDVR